MYFSESPENIIFISASSFYLKFLCEFRISWQSISHSIKQLSFCKRTRGVHVDVLLQFLVDCRLGLVLKEPELGHKILAILVSLSSKSIPSVLGPVVFHRREMIEKLGGEFAGAVVGTAKCCQLYRVSHPGLPE